LKVVKLQRKKAWEEVFEQIKGLIISGDWELGYRLPAETELAKQFGVSRPTLREALRQLNLLGLIDIRHGEGNFISHPDVNTFMLPLLPLLIKNKDNILEIMEARAMIEIETVSLAALRASEADIALLYDYHRQLKSCGNNKEQYAKTDYLLHKTIVLAASNQIITKMYQAIEELLIGQQLRTIGLPNAIEKSLEEHKKIIVAIQQRDPKAARGVMQEHMQKTLERILGLKEV
jgi:GntR family transcriptional repressor for pyruvate dehydrogenase complex